MEIEADRGPRVTETRERLLDVALTVLGQDPDAGMGEVASAAGVVRRTVYGHFPSRADLVRTLAQRAASEVAAVLDEVDAADEPADAVWAAFLVRLWPLVHRYRVLVVLRRGEHSDDVHALLAPVEKDLGRLVQRGQDSDVFGAHLPAGVLSQVAWAVVFAFADYDFPDDAAGVRAVTVTSLLLLGVPEARAESLAGGQP